ncbi:hypothetical protein ABT160_30095 [Streptomyces sp. NPDC001941]|uniref:hypothetical protein n=1 Tax=Streptomyces sp. NPDC001941 TaxID=3154659 RepID=UPI00333266D6
MSNADRIRILSSGGYRLLAYGEQGSQRPCGREDATGWCGHCHPGEYPDEGDVVTDFARVLSELATHDGAGHKTVIDKFAYVDYHTLVSALTEANGDVEHKGDKGAYRGLRLSPRLTQTIATVDRVTGGLIADLLSVPWSQVSAVFHHPVGMICETITEAGIRTELQFRLVYRDTSDPAPDAIPGGPYITPFATIESMSGIPEWFGWKTTLVTATPETRALPESERPVVGIPSKGRYDEQFKEVIMTELGVDRQVAEILYATTEWGSPAGWSAYDGICGDHLQVISGLTSLCVGIDFAQEPYSHLHPGALRDLAVGSVAAYRRADAAYLRRSVGVAAQSFLRRHQQARPDVAEAPLTPEEYVRCRYLDGGVYPWYTIIDQARAGRKGLLHGRIQRVIDQCPGAIAGLDLVMRFNDATDVWNDAHEGESYNELVQAVRYGYRGSFVPVTRALTAGCDVSCACVCPYAYHAEASDSGVGMVAYVCLIPRYNALASYAIYQEAVPDPESIDAFVCRPVPSDLQRMIFTPDWQIQPWVINATGDPESFAPPPGSQGRAPEQWANRIVDLRRDPQARDKIMVFLARECDQAPSAYCAKDTVRHVIKTAAPLAGHELLDDAAVLVASMWNLAVQLHHGQTPPEEASRMSARMFLRMDKLQYVAVRRQDNATATAVQRATMGYLSCIIELTRFRVFDRMVAYPHIARQIVL